MTGLQRASESSSQQKRASATAGSWAGTGRPRTARHARHRNGLRRAGAAAADRHRFDYGAMSAQSRTQTRRSRRRGAVTVRRMARLFAPAPQQIVNGRRAVSVFLQGADGGGGGRGVFSVRVSPRLCQPVPVMYRGLVDVSREVDSRPLCVGLVPRPDGEPVADKLAVHFGAVRRSPDHLDRVGTRAERLDDRRLPARRCGKGSECYRYVLGCCCILSIVLRL